MSDTGKQTALFFGFLTAAMTYASAQAAPVAPQPTGVASAQESVTKTTEGDRTRAARIEREIAARSPKTR